MNVFNECRVCFETTDQNLMVSPCHCRGSMAYIHLQCLKNCIETSGQQKCGICEQNWLGIDFVKKRKGFMNFLDEESLIFSFFYSIFAIIIAILSVISYYKMESPRIDLNWIILPHYFLYINSIQTFLSEIYFLYLIIIDYQILVKFNFKYIVIECKNN